MGRILRNHIETRREFKTFYKKGIEVLLKITSGNIEKEKLKLKKLLKGKVTNYLSSLFIAFS